MMDIIIKLHYNHIIKPLEKECSRLEAKIYSRKMLDFLSRSTYKEYLEIYRQLLCEQYGNLGKMISEELLFQDELIEKDPNFWQSDLTRAKSTPKQMAYTFDE